MFFTTDVTNFVHPCESTKTGDGSPADVTCCSCAQQNARCV